MKSEGVWLVRAYVELLDGDILAALMFSQIAYWNGYCVPGKSRLKVFKCGQPWLAKSAPQWREEIGLTEKQARRCVTVLKAYGLIETKQWKFNGSPTTHILLTPNGREAIFTCHHGHSHLSSKASSSALQGKSLTDTTAETVAESTADTHPAGDPAGETHTENQTLKTSEEEKKGKLGEVKNNVAALITIWNSYLPTFSVEYQQQLTNKEIGQLKMFRDGVGIDAPEALKYAMDNWAEFAWKAKVDKGLVKFPAYPQAGFLLNHYDTLMTLFLKSKEKTLGVAKPPWGKKFDYEQWSTYLATHNHKYPATEKEMSEWVAKTYHPHPPHY